MDESSVSPVATPKRKRLRNAILAGMLVLTAIVGGIILSIPPLPPLDAEFEKLHARLMAADTFELVSLQPAPTSGEYTELGRARIDDDLERASLVAPLVRSLGLQEPTAECFIPRHAIHAECGGVSIDLTICFECGEIIVQDAPPKRRFGMGRGAKRQYSDAARESFRAAVRRHRLPTPEGPSEGE